MEIVIDAEIICGYFKETVLETTSPLSGKSGFIFERIGSEDLAFLDEEGQIEYEWRSVVDLEWFDPWYARLLSDGGAILIPTEPCHTLHKQLEQLGFPRGSRDIWYIRTAMAVVKRYGQAIILTEDMDFYDPTQKQSAAKHRHRILHSGNGKVARHLRRKECVHIKCVASYYELIPAE